MKTLHCAVEGTVLGSRSVPVAPCALLLIETWPGPARWAQHPAGGGAQAQQSEPFHGSFIGINQCDFRFLLKKNSQHRSERRSMISIHSFIQPTLPECTRLSALLDGAPEWPRHTPA